MRTFASVTVVAWVALVLSSACFPVTDQPDGSSCTDDDGCASHTCREGFCSGRSCTLGNERTCDTGWRCVHSDPDPISGFFGADGSDTCRPLCGACPGSMHCAAGGKDGETLCSFGKAPLDLTVRVPSAVVTGQPTRLTAIASPPAGRLVTCEWETGDGKPSEATSGPELTHVFEVREQAQKFRIRVRCTDEGGRNGSAEEAVDVGCQTSEGSCTASVCCAQVGHHCLAAPVGTGLVCRAPNAPSLTIDGPAIIPRLEYADFGLAATGGEGEVRGVTWTFSSSSFSRNGTTVRQSFTKAGLVTIRATVNMSLGEDLEKTRDVMVCELDGGECSTTKPCCAPLTCKPRGITMVCQP